MNILTMTLADQKYVFPDIDIDLDIKSFRDLGGCSTREAYAMASNSIAKAERSGDYRAREYSKVTLDALHQIREVSELNPDMRWTLEGEILLEDGQTLATAMYPPEPVDEEELLGDDTDADLE